MRALAAVRRYGCDSTAFQTLEDGFGYWFDDALDGCVAYVDTGRAWVVAGAPIAAAEHVGEVARRFVADAIRHRRRPCFFAVEDRFLAATPSLGSVQIGEQPVWDPREWPATLAASRSLREQLRRARAKGVAVRSVDPRELAHGTAMRTAVDALVTRWLRGRAMAPMGFLVAVEPFAFADQRRYFVAEHDGALRGLLVLVPVPARDGWLFEDLLRDAQAPNGTLDALVDHAMRAIAADGARYATLGLAPLAGSVPRWLGVVRDATRALYDFRGVRAFKSRLRPARWDAIHLAYPRSTLPALALRDALTAFAGGSLVRFGLASAIRSPWFVVGPLAAMLVPWTVALASVDGPTWFPSPWIQRGWVLFDVALAVGLFVLARRWNRALATWLAAAITADAVVTLTEAMAFNVPRAHDVGAWVVLMAGCAAPMLAAVVLWAARTARERVAHI